MVSRTVVNENDVVIEILLLDDGLDCFCESPVLDVIVAENGQTEGNLLVDPLILGDAEFLIVLHKLELLD